MSTMTDTPYDLLIRGCTALTADPDNPVIEDAAIGIRGNRLAVVGRAADTKNLNARRAIAADGHVATHMAPLLKVMGANPVPTEPGTFANQRVAERVWLYLDQWGEGHVPPPPAFLTALLRELLYVSDWQAAFASDRLTKRILLARAAVTPAAAKH